MNPLIEACLSPGPSTGSISSVLRPRGRKRVNSNQSIDANDRSVSSSPKKQRTSYANMALPFNNTATPYETIMSLALSPSSVPKRLRLARCSSVTELPWSPSSDSPARRRTLSTSEEKQSLPKGSAARWLKNTPVTFDYAPPRTSSTVSARLLTCSERNILYFTRGDCVYFKNLDKSPAADAVQVCNLEAKKDGHVRSLASSYRRQLDTVAVGTSKGYIQLWDVNTKQIRASWKAVKNISALVWKGDTLTVGSAMGEIKSYDTRLPPQSIRYDPKKHNGHQDQITSLVWNGSRNCLASGDSSGRVYCWDGRSDVPMEVGEYVQGRKKIMHESSISALAWCPWNSGELVTADVNGVVRTWDITVHDPTIFWGLRTIYTKAAITSMHFSQKSACPELLLTHGGPVTSSQYIATGIFIAGRVDNSISVVDYPSFKSRAIFRPNSNTEPEKSIGDSVLDESATKLIYTTPADGKLNIANIWTIPEVERFSRTEYSRIDPRRLLMQL